MTNGQMKLRQIESKWPKSGLTNKNPTNGPIRDQQTAQPTIFQVLFYYTGVNVLGFGSLFKMYFCF